MKTKYAAAAAIAIAATALASCGSRKQQEPVPEAKPQDVAAMVACYLNDSRRPPASTTKEDVSRAVRELAEDPEAPARCRRELALAAEARTGAETGR